jgi:very-short-patch-repair endonuclease
MNMRFGPLGQKGGERRLNVAITRAKRSVKLVSSILPSDLDLTRTESLGVKLLREYIEFARTGITLPGTRGGGPTKDLFLDMVSEFLVSNGHKIHRYVGCSGYKIDIAVLHPEIPDRYVAGIECDGFSYASARTARDRDNLRKTVLESMGWRLYRVWSPEWIARKDIESQKLLAFISDSISDQGEADAVDEPQQSGPAQDADSLTEVIDEPLTEAATEYSFGGVPNANPYGFLEYIESKLEGPVDANADGSLRDDHEIAAAAVHIVRIEQPIHIELLYQRMAGVFGNQKATAPVRRGVDSAMRKLRGQLVKDADGFVTTAGFTEVQVRVPAPGAAQRQINHISLDEIGMAMLAVLDKTVGLTRDSLIDATSRALGYSRKGAKIQSCLDDSLQRLIRKERVEIVADKVRKVGGMNRG